MRARIVTWNVNGIRNPFSYSPWRRQTRKFEEMFDKLEADIVIFQECKIQRARLTDDMVMVEGWDVFYSFPRRRNGFSGVAVYTRNATCRPTRVEDGITGVLCPPRSETSYRDLPSRGGNGEGPIGGYPRQDQLTEGDVSATALDAEGRCLVLEFPGMVLIATYCPVTSDDLVRRKFRTAYLLAVEARVRNLVALGRGVVLAGDLNVFNSAADTAFVTAPNMPRMVQRPAQRIVSRLVFNGNDSVNANADENRMEDAGHGPPVLWDLTRLYHPGRIAMYTCWDMRMNYRPANKGARLDYIMCSSNIRQWFTFSDIQPHLHGSDHCPVFAELADTPANPVHLRVALNAPDPAGNGAAATRSALAMSTRRLPEFSGRRTINQMFSRPQNGGDAGSSSATPPAPHPPQQTINLPEGIALVESVNDPPPESTAAAIQAIMQWKSLYGDPRPPRCLHEYFCVRSLCTDVGPNLGRWYYACSRSAGPPGSSIYSVPQVERPDYPWRCPTFMWIDEPPLDEAGSSSNGVGGSGNGVGGSGNGVGGSGNGVGVSSNGVGSG